jgi:hypothetical protein
VTYLPAILDAVTILLFGWLLLELFDWVVRWLHERQVERQRKADWTAMEAKMAQWADADRDFARLQKRIQKGEK